MAGACGPLPAPGPLPGPQTSVVLVDPDPLSVVTSRQFGP
jgi:hypothetical protein